MFFPYRREAHNKHNVAIAARDSNSSSGVTAKDHSVHLLNGSWPPFNHIIPDQDGTPVVNCARREWRHNRGSRQWQQSHDLGFHHFPLDLTNDAEFFHSCCDPPGLGDESLPEHVIHRRVDVPMQEVMVMLH